MYCYRYLMAFKFSVVKFVVVVSCTWHCVLWHFAAHHSRWDNYRRAPKKNQQKINNNNKHWKNIRAGKSSTEWHIANQNFNWWMIYSSVVEHLSTYTAGFLFGVSNAINWTKYTKTHTFNSQSMEWKNCWIFISDNKNIHRHTLTQRERHTTVI